VPAKADDAVAIAKNEKKPESATVVANVAPSETVSNEEVKKVVSSKVTEPAKVSKEESEEDFAMPEV